MPTRSVRIRLPDEYAIRRAVESESRLRTGGKSSRQMLRSSRCSEEKENYMTMTSLPRLIPLDRADGEPVGGKAAQLAQLVRLGLCVPEGFVIVDAAPGRLPPELDEFSAQLGGPVAVRSSALEEDSAERSFAGQFETILGVSGAPAIRAAVEQCLASAFGARAEAYRNDTHAHGAVRMAVVVQRMVDAAAAGVVFTADPVTG